MPIPLLPLAAVGAGAAGAGAAGAGGLLAGAGGLLTSLLPALGALKAPPPPELVPPPSAIRPGSGGPGPDPALLAALFQLLQSASGQAQAIPTLGQLVGGGGSATSRPTLGL